MNVQDAHIQSGSDKCQGQWAIQWDEDNENDGSPKSIPAIHVAKSLTLYENLDVTEC
jgi:hypothetical protein